MTELDVINDMLATMGISPLNEANEDNPDVANCRRILRQESLNLQSESWWFNKERIDLFPDAKSTMIYAPADAIRCDPVQRYPSMPIVQRGRRMYDTDRNTYLFPDRASVECWLVRNIPFEDLPPTAQRVVALGAVMKFQQSYDADNNKAQRLLMELGLARQNLRAEHTRNIKANMLLKNSTMQRMNFIAGWSSRNRW